MATKTKTATKSASTAVSIIPAKELSAYNKEASKVEQFSASLVITSNEDYDKAMNAGLEFKATLDKITARKEEITKPLNASLKSVRELFKGIETPFDNALGTIRQKMLDFRSTQRAKQEEDKNKIAGRVERGTMKPETAVAKMSAMKEAPKTAASDAGSATARLVKKYRVTDKAKIPLEFMEPDMTKIKASFRAGTPVSGVEEYEEEELAFNSAR